MRKQKYISAKKAILGEKALRDEYAASGKKVRLVEAAAEWWKDGGEIVTAQQKNFTFWLI